MRPFSLVRRLGGADAQRVLAERRRQRPEASHECELQPIIANPTNPSATEKSVQNPWFGWLAPITAKTSGDRTAPR
jgi:hypothetical protein